VQLNYYTCLNCHETNETTVYMDEIGIKNVACTLKTWLNKQHDITDKTVGPPIGSVVINDLRLEDKDKNLKFEDKVL